MKSKDIPLPVPPQGTEVPLASLLERVETPGRADWSDIPDSPGVYAVYLPGDVPIEVAEDVPADVAERIREKWDLMNRRETTDILYFGAGTSLRQGIRALARAGADPEGGPRGGEWLWLVKSIRSARLLWAECPPGKQKKLKTTLLACFLEEHGEWPLANRRYR